MLSSQSFKRIQTQLGRDFNACAQHVQASDVICQKKIVDILFMIIRTHFQDTTCDSSPAQISIHDTQPFAVLISQKSVSWFLCSYMHRQILVSAPQIC
jgi:hypothetical protein